MKKETIFFAGIGIVLVGIVVIVTIFITAYTPQIPVVNIPPLISNDQSVKNAPLTPKIETPPVSITPPIVANNNVEKPVPKTYELTEAEKKLYAQAVGFLKPDFIKTIYTIEYYKGLQEMVKLLEDLISQFPDSVYIGYYQETLALINQMIQDKDQVKYSLGGKDSNLVMPPRPAIMDKDGKEASLSLDEKIDLYIYLLRYNFFDKNNRFNKEDNYKLAFVSVIDRERPSNFTAAKLVLAGKSAIPKLIGLLEDRRPIIVADDTKIPAVFYRYQDAAVEILQEIFIPKRSRYRRGEKIPVATRPFPVEIPHSEYFSEYLEKQTPEEKQRVISEIKQWVEDSIKEYSESEQQPK